MFKIALILAISAICFAADALPASTVNAVKAYDAEMAKAKAEYDRKDDAAKKVLVAALTKAQAAEMKANNLEGALAIKKRIDELAPKGDLLGDQIDISKAIIGKWKITNNGKEYDFTFNENMTMKTGSNQTAKYKVSNNIIVITFDGGFTNTINQVNSDSLTGKDRDGNVFTGVKSSN
jgi:hypothetical protein